MAGRRPPRILPRRLGTTPAPAPEESQSAPTTPPIGAELNSVDHLVGAESVLHYRSIDRLPAEQGAQEQQPPSTIADGTTTTPTSGQDPPHYSADQLLEIVVDPNTSPAGRVVVRNLFTGEYKPVEWTADRGPVPSTSHQGEGDSTYYRDPPPLPEQQQQQQRANKRDLSARELPPAKRLDLRATPPSLIHAGPMRTSWPTVPVTTTAAHTTTTATVTTTSTRAAAGPLPIKMDPRYAPAQQRAELHRSASAALPQLSPRYDLHGNPSLQMSYSELAAAPVQHQPDQPTTQDTETPRKAGIPPIQVDVLPNWTGHFKALKAILGTAPSARPMGKGVRFLPKTVEEFRAVQAYLEEARRKEPCISGHTFALESDRPHKVAIHGLPRDTPMEELLEDLEAAIGVRPQYARMIPPRRGRPKTTFFVQFPHLPQDQLRRLYDVKELLYMPGVEVKEWTRRPGPPQCHRCQAFGHSSAGCFRDPRCVRCGEPHPAADCPRDTAQLKCCNCGKSHAANSRQCPALRREARKRGIQLQASLPQKKPQRAQQHKPGAAATTPSAPPPPPTHSEPSQALNLMAPANGPTDRGSSVKKKTKRGGKNKKNKKKKKYPTKEEGMETENNRPPASDRAPTEVTTIPTTVPIPPPAATIPSRSEETATQPQRAELAFNHEQHQKAALQATIEVLLEVLQKLQAGATPLVAVTHGFSRLCKLLSGQY